MTEIIVLTTVHHYHDARIFFKELQSIKKKYSNVLFIAQNEHENDFVEEGIKISPLPIPKNKYQRFFLQFRAFKIIRSKNPKILHIHDPELIILGLFVKIFFSVKVIFDVHENVSASLSKNLWVPKLIKPYLPFFYNRIEKLIIKYFNSIIIAEESYRKIYSKNTTLILNYPLLDYQDIFIDKEKSFDFPIRFVYSGRIWERRGIFKMLILMQRFVSENYDVFLDLVGPFATKELEISVKEFLSQHRLENNVVIHGRKTISEVYDILKNCHVGLSFLEEFENYKESLPTKIFDYMLAGLPYVVSNFEIYYKYTFLENTGIMINYDDNENIYNSVKNLILDKNKMMQMGKNGQQAVIKKWNWNSEEKKLLDIYQNLIE